MVGFSLRTCRDKGVGMFKVLAIITNIKGEEAEQRSIERRNLWISAISRGYLTTKILENDRVCENHFVSKRPAPPWHRHVAIGSRH